MARIWSKLAIGAAVAAAGATAGWLLRDLPSQMGSRPLTGEGARSDRIRRSRQFDGRTFVNPMNGDANVAPPVSLLRELASDRRLRQPPGLIPLAVPAFDDAPRDQVRAIWFGHSTVLVDIEGRRILLDPVWSHRVSPSRLVGPRRHHEPPIGLNALPPLDAVVISHDHYDHLDRDTIVALATDTDVQFVVPLGIGAHLERWGIPTGRCTELDWNETIEIAGIAITATAARHFSGRSLKRNDTLWSSWVLAGQEQRVFYAGDSGYFEGYRRIGADYGPFDLVVLPVGAYHTAWPDIHMTPEEAVKAQQDLGGGLLLPVHWATFSLAMHPWGEPVDRLWNEAKAHDIPIVVPRPGEAVEVGRPQPVDGWWQTMRDNNHLNHR